MKQKEVRKKKGSNEAKNSEREDCHCPYCTFMDMFSIERKRNEEFWKHVDRAQVELLEAFRSLIDKKIDHIKGRNHGSSEGLTKIEIEEED